MEQVKKKLHKGKRSRYRIRDFKCTVCGHEERVFAGGDQEDNWFQNIK